jgi:hypothetical protein
MLILMNGSMPVVMGNRDVIPFGLLLTPLGGLGVDTAFGTDMEIGVDNGYFTKRDPEGFRRLLRRIPDPSRPRFVACPDVVGDCAATLALFDAWEPEIRGMGFRVALVGQDGMERLSPSDRSHYWGRCSAFFVGGSDAFKLLPDSPAHALIREAKAAGLWVHFGRVNSVRRIVYCARLGVDSVDGSGLVRSSRDKLPRLLSYHRRKNVHPLFAEESA